MAARYVRIGQYPDYRDEIRGTLSEILASTANPGTYASPEDVTGTFLEMGSDGLWTGASVGTLTQVQADALVASGAMGKVKIGTPAEIDGAHVRWTGTAWQSDLLVGPFADIPDADAWAAANPSSLFPGLLATAGGVQYTWQGEWVRSDGVRFCMVDPAAVVSAASISAVDFPIYTIKGGTFRDGDILELTAPAEMGANTGSDLVGLVLNSVMVDASPSVANALHQVAFGVTKSGTTTRKIIAQGSTSFRTNTHANTSIDWAQDVIVKIRIIPATIGNTTYIRHAQVKVTKC